MAAIDFTASNGDPQSLTSNHSLLKELNDYEKVLSDMGQQIEIEKQGGNQINSPIGEEIDFSSSFQVFGFGGIPRYMDINSVNHCFALNGDPLNPEIRGIENVLLTYRKVLPQIDMAGPTQFGPLLDQFLLYVKSMKNH